MSDIAPGTEQEPYFLLKIHCADIVLLKGTMCVRLRQTQAGKGTYGGWPNL